MPHLVTNVGARQSHPLYEKSSSPQQVLIGKKVPDKGPDKTEYIPKTYDAIKTAAGADARPAGRK